jgi:hypothetical protein
MTSPSTSDRRSTSIWWRHRPAWRLRLAPREPKVGERIETHSTSAEPRHPEAQRATLIEQHPIKRLGMPEDVAREVLA